MHSENDRFVNGLNNSAATSGDKTVGVWPPRECGHAQVASKSRMVEMYCVCDVESKRLKIPIQTQYYTLGLILYSR